MPRCPHTVTMATRPTHLPPMLRMLRTTAARTAPLLAALAFPAALLAAKAAPTAPLQEEEATQKEIYPPLPEASPPPTELEAANAKDERTMARYDETITGTEVTFAMTPIPGGTFLMGSPEGEEDLCERDRRRRVRAMAEEAGGRGLRR